MKTATTQQLVELTGLDAKRLKDLAAGNKIPEPDGDTWPLYETVQALCKFASGSRSQALRDYYDTIAGAALGLGITKELLKKAKRAGCPAFRSNRVYTQPLIAWICKQTRPEHTMDDAKARMVAAQAAMLETKARAQARELVPMSEAIANGFVAWSPFRAAIREAPGQLAPRCNPENPAQALRTLQDWSRNTLTRLYAHLVRTAENFDPDHRAPIPPADDGDAGRLGGETHSVSRTDEPRPLQPGPEGIPPGTA